MSRTKFFKVLIEDTPVSVLVSGFRARQPAIINSNKVNGTVQNRRWATEKFKPTNITPPKKKRKK